jgi:hypothetical protein
MTWIVRDDCDQNGRSYLRCWEEDDTGMGTTATWTTRQSDAQRFDHPEVARLTSLLNGGKPVRLVARQKTAA